MEFVAAEKYTKIKHIGWPEHAAMITASVSVMTSGVVRLQNHMNNFSSYTIVRVAPRVAAFLCGISSSSERGFYETRVARVSGTKYLCEMATFCTCIVVQIFPQ
jgi:hypothetical protein